MLILLGNQLTYSQNRQNDLKDLAVINHKGTEYVILAPERIKVANRKFIEREMCLEENMILKSKIESYKILERQYIELDSLCTLEGQYLDSQVVLLKGGIEGYQKEIVAQREENKAQKRFKKFFFYVSLVELMLILILI